MNRSNIHLLDFPNEILLIILRKLNNIDVLYSLVDINNGPLDIFAQEKMFTNTLNFTYTDDISLIDRYCINILPRINHNIKCFILEPVLLERILLAAVYPNLTEFKLFNFEQQIVSKYFTVASGDLFHNLSRERIQQTLINIGQHNTATIVNYLSRCTAECSIFSLPFTFDYLRYLGNIFPNIVFNYVTYLLVEDHDAFGHEFFVRIARSFPLLKHLHILNIQPQLSSNLTLSSDHCQSYSIIEYPHLTSLDVICSLTDYLEQFLDETKASVPCLTELEVSYRYLKTVTNNFTREETRRNCAKVKKLIAIEQFDNSQDFYHYFPSFEMYSRFD
ncbi:unnamed protein product [Rotaria socialis]|uniref:F-box domain-containing protein n=1 Tax=Rotaria socialis TaxID=392032 RepID=A0A820M9V6_9BILA|nr:unnamed protein product [Rotaria socialis]CAF4369867.1 unnamed protein product [Rotaria socialis]